MSLRKSLTACGAVAGAVALDHNNSNPVSDGGIVRMDDFGNETDAAGTLKGQPQNSLLEMNEKEVALGQKTTFSDMAQRNQGIGMSQDLEEPFAVKVKKQNERLANEMEKQVEKLRLVGRGNSFGAEVRVMSI